MSPLPPPALTHASSRSGRPPDAPRRRCLSLCAGPLLAAAALPRLAVASQAAAPRRLRVVALDMPPLIMSEPSGRAGGVIVDALHQVLAGSGFAAQVEILPWARALQRLRLGEAEGIIPAFRTPERERWLSYPGEPLYRSPMAFFGKRGRDFGWDGHLQSVQRLRFVKLKDGLFADGFDEAVRQGRLRCEEALSFGAAMRMVNQGRADLACAPLLPGLRAISLEGLDERLAALEPAVELKAGFLALLRQPELSELAQRITPSIARLHRSGQIQAWVDEYRRRQWAPRPDPAGTPRSGHEPGPQNAVARGPIWG